MAWYKLILLSRQENFYGMGFKKSNFLLVMNNFYGIINEI